MMSDNQPQILNRRKLLKFIRQTVLLNSAAAAAVIGMTAAFGSLQSALAWRSIVAALVYSTCIGTLSSATIFFIIKTRHNDSTALRLVKLTAVIFAATFAGIVLSNAIFAVVGMALWTKVLTFSFGQLWFSLTIALVFGFSAYFYELSQAHLAAARERLQQKEIDTARAETMATEAQLASLESRLHPHFLFNTLNSIAALIREDADLAEKTVEQLARLLRYSLDTNHNRLVSLAQELKITRDYLSIEAVRFGSRLDFEIRIDKQFDGVQVPPFALQTLVENSIKHVASKRPGNLRIEIAAAARNGFLEIEVLDDGSGFTRANLQNGHGLDNLRQRLNTIFKTQAALEIGGGTKQGARVLIRVPLTEQNADAIETARVFG